MTETIDNGKIPLTFILATTVALLCAASVECVAAGFGLAQAGSCSSTVARYLLSGSFIAYPVALVVGTPLYFAFRNFGWLKVWQVTTGSTFLGLVAAVVVRSLTPASFAAGTYFAFIAIGAAIGILFWAIGVRRLEP